MAAGDFSHGTGVELAPGEVDGHGSKGADFNTTETIASVAADAVAVVALLVLIGDAVAAARVGAVGTAGVGRKAAIFAVIIAFLARVDCAIAAVIRTLPIHARSEQATFSIQTAGGAYAIKTTQTLAFTVATAGLAVLQPAVARATVAVGGIAVVTRFARLHDTVPHDRLQNAAALVAAAIVSAVAVDVACHAPLAAAEAALALFGLDARLPVRGSRTDAVLAIAAAALGVTGARQTELGELDTDGRLAANA